MRIAKIHTPKLARFSHCTIRLHGNGVLRKFSWRAFIQ